MCFGNISKVGLKLGWVFFSSVYLVCYCFSGDLLHGTSPGVWSRFFGDGRFLHCCTCGSFCRSFLVAGNVVCPLCALSFFVQCAVLSMIFGRF